MPPIEPTYQRYSRQIFFDPIGEEGQRKLGKARVVLIGCGALGSVLADSMVRAGVGHVRICDRDYVETDNLQRQTLFTEQDVADGLPKAEAARRRLSCINSTVGVEGVVTDVNPSNIEQLIGGASLILDGTDNFETRYLVNDVAIKHVVPWIYGAAVAAVGLAMPILPGETPCLRCVFEDAPPPELSPTCDTIGVIGPLIHLVAGVEAAEALKILTGNKQAVIRHLTSIDAWSGRFTSINVRSARERRDCVCCRQRRFEYLEGDRIGSAGHLCGRGAIQINRTGGQTLDLVLLADKLRRVADQLEAFLRSRLLDRDPQKAALVDVHAWLHEPGLRDDAPVAASDGIALVDRELERRAGGVAPAELATDDWVTQQWLHFLESLPDSTTPADMAALDAAFALTASGNSEILFTWLKLAIRARYAASDERLEQFLMTVGRRKYLQPLYEELVKTEAGRERAREIYARARPRYHAVSSLTLDKIVPTGE